MTQAEASRAKEGLSVHDMVERILTKKFKNIRLSKPASHIICSGHLQKLLQGFVLNFDEMIDLCTLRDDVQEMQGFRTGFEVIFRNMSESENMELIRNRLWRRVLLATEYVFISKTLTVSWASLLQLTKKISDTELKDRLRNTPLHNVLSFMYYRCSFLPISIILI